MQFLKCFAFIVLAFINLTAFAQENNTLINKPLRYPVDIKEKTNVDEFNDLEVTSCLPGIISYWKLDEKTQGNYTDFIGFNDAKGMVSPSATKGQVNGGQYFNGSTAKLSVSANPSFDFGNQSSFSVEFWYKGTILPSSVKSVIGRYIRETNSKWFVGINANDGKAKFYMNSGNNSAAINGNSIVDGKWHYVAATRNGSNGLIKIYVDGALCASTTRVFTAGFISSTANLNIGWLSFQDVYTMNGNLDEIAIYNIELSQSEIQKHYHKGLAGLGYCKGKDNLAAPLITSVPVEQATAGKLYSYNVKATGNPKPVYQLINFPDGMTIDSITGVIKWLPELSSGHSVSVTVAAHNGVLPNFSQTFFISVTGAISYWDFDETIPGNYNDLILDCDATAIVPPVPTTGQVNGAQYFNGTAKVDVRKNQQFFNFRVHDDFSIEFWYKGTTPPSTVKCAIGRFIPETNARWFVGLNAVDGKARVYMTVGGESVAINGNPVVDGRWHHVAATRNGSTGMLSLYVDGILNGSSSHAFTTDFSSSTANLNIGWLSFQSVYGLEGSLDEIAIYKIELSPSEILKHYNYGLSGLGYLDDPYQLTKKNGAKEISETVKSGNPVKYLLYQNYPNPFNPSTMIRFSLPEQQRVKISIYNQLGENIIELVNQNYNAGSYEVEFNASAYNLSSGIYFYRMEAGEYINVRKFLLIK